MKTRSVRRRPEAERWGEKQLDSVQCLPWSANEKPVDAAVSSRRRYITQKMVTQYGPTAGCGGCAGTGLHIPRCRARFEKLWAAEAPKITYTSPPVAAEAPVGEAPEEAEPALASGALPPRVAGS